MRDFFQKCLVYIFTWHLNTFFPKFSLIQRIWGKKCHDKESHNTKTKQKYKNRESAVIKLLKLFRFSHYILSDAPLLSLHLLSVGPLSRRIQLNCRLSCFCGPSGLQLCIIPLQPNSFDTHWLTDPIDNIIKSVLDTNRVRITHLTPPYIFLMCNLKRWKNEINRNVSC